MKIIASLGGPSRCQKFLVQMTESEIRALAGLEYKSAVEIGMTLEAGENARQIEKIRGSMNSCKRAAADLRSLADLLDSELKGLKMQTEDDDGSGS